MHEYFHNLVSGRRRGLGAALQRGGLRLLSVPYGWGTGLRNKLFDWGWKKSEAVSVPVVSVGNLTLGGTGKTPCVEYLARFYRQEDLRVAILSRGYGAKEGRNDEALVLESNLPDVPHLQGADRVALARIAVEELESEILLLDDGFQHRRLHRNLDIVLIDATQPWGYGYSFPRGLLRESPRGLKRAGLLMLTRCDQVEPSAKEAIKDRVKKLAAGVAIVETSHRPTSWINADGEEKLLEALRGKPLAAFCGLGNPEAFRQTVERLGGPLADFRTFPDHHAYARDDVEDLRSWARRQPKDAVVVTTQKDLVKLRLPRIGERELLALRIQLHVDEGQDLLDRILKEVLG